MDYYKTPDNFPIISEIKNKSCCKTDDTRAYVCFMIRMHYIYHMQ